VPGPEDLDPGQVGLDDLAGRSRKANAGGFDVGGVVDNVGNEVVAVEVLGADLVDHSTAAGGDIVACMLGAYQKNEDEGKVRGQVVAHRGPPAGSIGPTTFPGGLGAGMPPG